MAGRGYRFHQSVVDFGYWTPSRIQFVRRSKPRYYLLMGRIHMASLLPARVELRSRRETYPSKPLKHSALCRHALDLSILSIGMFKPPFRSDLWVVQIGQPLFWPSTAPKGANSHAIYGIYALVVTLCEICVGHGHAPRRTMPPCPPSRGPRQLINSLNRGHSSINKV